MSEQSLTQDEAENLAAKVVGQFLCDCRMTDESQISDYLMKLLAMAGVGMAQAEGCESAAERLNATAEWIANNMPRQPAKIVRMQ